MTTHKRANALRWASPLLLGLWSILCGAQDVAPGSVERIATRDGVSVPVYSAWRKDAQATVLLFSGGAGGYGQLGADGWPNSGNFLIRTGKRWASHPFNIVMIGRPSDGIDLASGAIRVGEAHAADTMAILRAVKTKSALPVWVVGTSMGTISATAASIRDEEGLIAGLVLTSSITGYQVEGAVPRQPLGKISVPTLVFHHADDSCRICQPDEARRIEQRLDRAPVKTTMIVNGGGGATGNPCQAFHHHGFIGMENEAVDLIAHWILNPEERTSAERK